MWTEYAKEKKIEYVTHLTFLYVRIFQIEDPDASAGNMTGSHDLQLTSPGQPISQATGTDTVLITDQSCSSHLNISCLFAILNNYIQFIFLDTH